MTPFLRAARLVLLPAVLAGWIASPALAQEAAPEPEAAAPAEKPKPKRPPAPRPVKPAAKPEVKPAEKATPAQAAPAKAVWPEGASAVSEVYGDWTVNCARTQDATPKPATPQPATCSLIQSQGDPKTGRRTFVFELRPPKDGRADGVILMPFGFSIEPGVSFKLDDTVLGKGAVYSFCGGDGCYVPISLPTLATDTMRTATTLTVSAQKPNETEPTLIKVPLVGFAAAFDRLVGFGG